MPVYCVDSKRPVGKVDGWLDSADFGTELLVRSGWLNSVLKRIPGADVDSVDADRVLLSINRWLFDARPVYVPDEDLEQAVYDALKAVGPIKYHALRRIEVTVRHGVVRLSGHVAKELHRHEAIEAVAAVPGVVRVQDELVSDEQLVTAVAVAMRAYPRLQPSRVAVQANLGTVILEGELDSPQDVDLARNVALSVPGVLSVENRLRVRGTPPGRAPATPWPSGGGTSGLVVLVSAEWPPWRQAGELVIDRETLTDAVGREVIR
jgi:osmotically-inducible protein OsmY